MSVERVAIFRVVNASRGEKSCLQFSIPTGSGAGGEGGVSHSLKLSLKLLGYISGTCKHFHNSQTVKLSYTSLVRSKLEYASLVWSPVYTKYVHSMY